ncbi:MAG: hypothetical protein LIP05_15240 [Tannerellaceae bacterium]|nr:hypothetical protein [Tannerellaceae bacterium]
MKKIRTVPALGWLILEAPASFEHISRMEQIPAKDPETQKQLDEFKIKIRKVCIHSFKACIDAGLFISLTDPETIASIYIEEIKNLKPKFRMAMIYSFGWNGGKYQIMDE